MAIGGERSSRGWLAFTARFDADCCVAPIGSNGEITLRCGQESLSGLRRSRWLLKLAWEQIVGRGYLFVVAELRQSFAVSERLALPARYPSR